MSRKAAVAAAVIAMAVVCVAAFAIIASQGQEYSITYELNGGEQNPLNPDSYVSGEGAELHSALSDDYYFDGWFLDPELTERCDSITDDMEGDITLYAGWSESVMGRGFTLGLEGTVHNGPFTSYGITGEATYRYLYLDQESGTYLMEVTNRLTYNYGLYSYDSTSTDTYWSGESDVTWTQGATETIDTVDGPVECTIMIATYPDGSTETQWIGDGWIPYKIEYKSDGLLSSSRLTYTLVETFTFETDDEVEVVTYSDDGITVSGDGTYTPGSPVTLTADVADGHTFGGWYDSSGSLLSASTTYTMDMVGSDVEVYAANGESSDETWQDDTEYDLLRGTVLDSATATIVSMDSGDTIAVLEDPTPMFTFSDAGEYVVVIDGFDSDGNAHRTFYHVLVDGSVTRTFQWYSGGETYTYTLEMDYSDVVYYRDLYSVDERMQDTNGHVRDATFVTWQNPVIQEIAVDFRSMVLDNDPGATDLDIVNMVVAFTQYIEYQSDDVFTGYEEYWKFPLETLYDQGGDCEDTSILCAAITKAMGYDSALLLFPGHMAAGVDVDGATGTYYGSGGRSYYYCETTATGYDVGDVPSSVDYYQAVVVPIA